MAPGNYLLQAEPVALHVAGSLGGGAQLYMSFCQTDVAGGGSAEPRGVLFSSAYSASDPGFMINICFSILRLQATSSPVQARSSRSRYCHVQGFRALLVSYCQVERLERDEIQRDNFYFTYMCCSMHVMKLFLPLSLEYARWQIAPLTPQPSWERQDLFVLPWAHWIGKRRQFNHAITRSVCTVLYCTIAR